MSLPSSSTENSPPWSSPPELWPLCKVAPSVHFHWQQLHNSRNHTVYSSEVSYLVLLDVFSFNPGNKAPADLSTVIISRLLSLSHSEDGFLALLLQHAVLSRTVAPYSMVIPFLDTPQAFLYSSLDVLLSSDAQIQFINAQTRITDYAHAMAQVGFLSLEVS